MYLINSKVKKSSVKEIELFFFLIIVLNNLPCQLHELHLNRQIGAILILIVS